MTLHPIRAIGYLFKAVYALISIPASIVKAIALLIARFFMQGWMPFIGGIGLTWWGIAGIERDSAFSSGVSLMILGIGLMLRTGLRYTSMHVSGIFMVAAAVWTIMYNSDLLLRGLAVVTSRIGQLRPVLVTAVAYPMSNKFRTGLTVAMFALVIFTLMVMSVLSETFSTQFEETATITGGWHIRGFVNVNMPIEDLRRDIEADPDLRIEDFTAIGDYTGTGVQVQQLDVEDPKWEGSWVWAVDDEFLANTEHRFKLVAEGFGPTGAEIWKALKDDPTLAVASGFAVATREDAGPSGEREPWLQDLYSHISQISPVGAS